ncbi:hypothetical protein T8T21_03840 [Limimaricola variabilis]|uniref:hypothetical protein n=1 Tax=Limimaricola variabilis TaxID=1492771 RepID=UPI002AC9999B|nr:hypothetical protein [Limimaricola variabilis]WPY95267.1 hypothetical protein T8T21_03840 [Limimaricola variabilis]
MAAGAAFLFLADFDHEADHPVGQNGKILFALIEGEAQAARGIPDRGQGGSDIAQEDSIAQRRARRFLNRHRHFSGLSGARTGQGAQAIGGLDVDRGVGDQDVRHDL